jgi:hypothetical protein
MAVSPDGQRFLLSVAVDEPRPTEVDLNWRGPARMMTITTPAR